MTSAYTPLLGFVLPVTGELSGTWGSVWNDSGTSLIDAAIAGTTTLSVDADVTLTTTQGASNTAREAILLWTASGTATRTITVPAQSKIYTVINKTGSTQSIKIVGAGPTTGVTLIAGESAQIAWNGSDFVKVGELGGDVSFRNVTITGTLGVSGTTTLAGVSATSVTNSGLTSGRVVYSTTGGLETDSANLTFNGTTLTANTLNLTNALGTAYGGTGLTSFTANGVVYASSTSALTTGSALTFDGAATLGLSTSSATTTNTSFNIYGANTGANSGSQINFFYGATNQAIIGNYSRVIGSGAFNPDLTFYSNGNNFVWYSGSEAMRLTSTGLGIGTSSPSYKLDVVGTGSIISATRADTNRADMIVTNNGGTVAFGINNSTGSWLTNGLPYYGYILGPSSSSYGLQFGVGASNTAALTINPSGNLGLGVTPSAWAGTGAPILQIGGASANIAGNTQYFNLTANAYYNSGYKYIGTGYATYYAQDSGKHLWLTAPSGTAGSAISFTQAMTLDASGNLGVGTTSPTARLSVYTTNALVSDFTANRSSGGYLQFVLGANAGNLGYLGAANQIIASGSVSDLGLRAEGSLVFSTNGNPERARIDSSGNLLVGKTALDITTLGAQLRPGGQITSTLAGTTAATDTLDVYSTGAGAYRFYVDMAGTVHATSIVISAISDQRLKENVRDIDTGLDAIMALKPRRFDWKEGKGQDKKNAAGFIAQEFGEVFPASLSTSKAGGDGIEYITMNHEELIPSLVKAIQELKAEFDAYKASHP